MSRLSDNKIRTMIAEMEDAAAGGDATFAPWHTEHGLTPVTLEFPGGEIDNPALVGWLMAWRMTGRIQSAPLKPQDRFSAQGLEGKLTVDTTLSTALMVWRSLPEHRCQIIA